MAGIKKDIEKWNVVKEHLGDEKITLGPYFSYQIKHSPRRIIFALSRYKFAAKLIGDDKTILEVGCSEGLGTVILGEFARRVVGIDIDADAVREANRAFASAKMEFKYADIIGPKFGDFDAAVSFDVIEHIDRENEDLFITSICGNLKDNGLCIIGTPNITADSYASEASKIGHVNMYTWDRLKNVMDKYFKQVFIFSSNDEIVHTGFYPMAHYLIAVGINKKV